MSWDQGISDLEVKQSGALVLLLLFTFPLAMSGYSVVKLSHLWIKNGCVIVISDL